MGGVRLREALIEDVPALVPLMGTLGYPTDEGRLREGLAAILADPSYRTVVAEEGDSVVGLVGMRRGLRYEAGSYVQLAALVVAEGQQGRGVGSALVREVERWARAQGARMITLNSAHHRTDAHRFYERLGYEATGLRFSKRIAEGEA
jgi:ribosomal protein S18 acetylase RimI-like enzyme